MVHPCVILPGASRSPVRRGFWRPHGAPGYSSSDGGRDPRHHPVRGAQDTSSVVALQGVCDAMAVAVLGDRVAATEQPDAARWAVTRCDGAGWARAAHCGPRLLRMARGNEVPAAARGHPVAEGRTNPEPPD